MNLTCTTNSFNGSRLDVVMASNFIRGDKATSRRDKLTTPYNYLEQPNIFINYHLTVSHIANVRLTLSITVCYYNTTFTYVRRPDLKKLKSCRTDRIGRGPGEDRRHNELLQPSHSLGFLASLPSGGCLSPLVIFLRNAILPLWKLAICRKFRLLISSKNYKSWIPSPSSSYHMRIKP